MCDNSGMKMKIKRSHWWKDLPKCLYWQHYGNKGCGLTTRTDESEIFVYNHEGFDCNCETRLNRLQQWTYTKFLYIVFKSKSKCKGYNTADLKT